MSSLYSPYWYRLAELKPVLQRHVSIHRHFYRGERWYVVKNSSNGRHHRFNKAAYALIGMLDGTKTLAEVWETVLNRLGDEAPSQDDTINLLSRLYHADLLKSEVLPDIAELFKRRQQQQKSSIQQKFSNPFALRFPLVNPDAFLQRWQFLIRPLATWLGVICWSLIVVTGAALTFSHWPELTNNMIDKVLTPGNLVLLWLCYPLIKLMHELAHAFLTRIWGGEVNEMGIVILAFTPIPYVEASSSAAFTDKRKRMAVAAVGMATEMCIASLALLLWLNVQPGLLRSIAYNVFLIGGVSTLLFNGNPLLKFDGYYVLADAIEIPNLAQRSTKYLGYLFKRYLVGVADSHSPVTAPGERRWFFCYGIAAFCYRIMVLMTLIMLVSKKFFIVGILIAIWGAASQIVIPLVRNLSRFLGTTSVQHKQSRLLLLSLGLVSSLAVLIFATPFPLTTRAEGVIWLPEYARVRAGTDCFITEIVAESNALVSRGETLIRCEDPLLASTVEVLAATAQEYKARYHAETLQARVKREIIKNRLKPVEADLAQARERLEHLTITSQHAGNFIVSDPQSLLGRYVQQGEVLGYILNDSDLTVNVAVDQNKASLVQRQTSEVEIRFAERLNAPLHTKISTEIPAASDQLPSPVLGTGGGGKIPVDPSDPEQLRTLSKIFKFQLALPHKSKDIKLGSRVHVLFRHGYEPLAWQWQRLLRQLFLSRFQV